jgi:hypothetical protein
MGKSQPATWGILGGSCGDVITQLGLPQRTDVTVVIRKGHILVNALQLLRHAYISCFIYISIEFVQLSLFTHEARGRANELCGQLVSFITPVSWSRKINSWRRRKWVEPLLHVQFAPILGLLSLETNDDAFLSALVTQRQVRGWFGRSCRGRF